MRNAIWLAFFLAAFVVTHIPPSKVPGPGLINDKILHMTGFTGLSVITFWRMAVRGRAIPMRTLVGGFIFLLCYAAFDELTQPFFRRDCEFLDWVADAGGSLIGIALLTTTHHWYGVGR